MNWIPFIKVVAWIVAAACAFRVVMLLNNFLSPSTSYLAIYVRRGKDKADIEVIRQCVRPASLVILSLLVIFVLLP